MALPSEQAHVPRSRPAPGSAPALALIVAVAANGTIGAGNALPWRLPDDLKHFRSLTTGHAVIMGRRTWDSLGRPLSDRQNIVVTRDSAWKAAGAEVAHSLEEALAMVRLPAPAFCIGGAQLFEVALPLADRLHVTEIARPFVGDTFWAPPDASQWREIARETRRLEGADGFDYAFVTYERSRPQGRVG